MLLIQRRSAGKDVVSEGLLDTSVPQTEGTGEMNFPSFGGCELWVVGNG